MFSIRNFIAITALCALCLQQQSHFGCQAWVSPVVVSQSTPVRSTNFAAARSTSRYTPAVLYSTATDTGSAVASTKDDEEEDDDDDEYEYVEYENLTEEDFLNSEWQVGTCWDNNQNRIDETWARLVVKGDKNVAIWGDNSEGTWSLDVASQFLTISKNYFWGKQIWAGVVDDYYYLKGTVRGWTYLTAASVEGQWQSKRLGVDPEEAGTPPWFEDPEEDVEEEKPAEAAASAAVEEKTEEKVESKETDSDEEEDKPKEVKASKDEDDDEEKSKDSEASKKTEDAKEQSTDVKKTDDDKDKPEEKTESKS